MLLGVLDCETNGLNLADSSVIEFAIALYDTQTKSVVAELSSLVPMREGVKVNKAEKINNISSISLNSATTKKISKYSIDLLVSLIEACDYLVAHNADFDHRFIDDLLESRGKDKTAKTWVCSYKQLVFPLQTKQGKLSKVAEEHGLPVQDLHRAGGDIRLLVELLKLSDDIEEQIKGKKVPYYERDGWELVNKVTPAAHSASEWPRRCEACVTYETKDLAKAAGFTWNPTVRKWLKELNKEQFESAENQFGFRVEVY
jgi:DNA polymerase-3 subunit epsilon